MKKSTKIIALFLTTLSMLIISIGIYLHYHPIQDFTSVTSTGIQYPEVMYTPYKWVGMPDKLVNQKDEFNEGIYKVVQQKMDRYSEDIDLTYDLDRHDEGGVTVTLYGNGTTKEGKKEEFKEVLEFPITIEKRY